MTNRREFLSTVLGSSAVLSFTGTAPDVLLHTALAGEKSNSDRVLVVLQMSGGNDGLNTVIPHTHDVYRKNRKALRVGSSDVLGIDKQYGLHPELRGFAELLEAGRLGIVPAVGYPQPNRSHFESMDIWHTCLRKSANRRTGWLGKLLEHGVKAPGALSGMHVGSEKQPLALAAQKIRVPSVSSLERFRLETNGNKKLGKVLEQALAAQQATNENDLLGFLSSSTRSAVAANKRIQKVREAKAKDTGYPQSPLGRKLSTVARLIQADMPTRVYYVSLDGFDTHARQQNAHAALLRQVGDAVAAFNKDLQATGHSERTLLVSFSEFGRRVAENASEGTDHGTAGPMFVVGEKVRPGFLAPHADLSKLQNGDLRFRTDFRGVYAALIEDWFGIKDSRKVLGSEHQKLKRILI